MNRYVALIPSVQHNYGLGGYVEGLGMKTVGDKALEMLRRVPGYEARLFWPGMETGPDFPVLRQQQREAEEWLRSVPAEYSEKAVLNLHSDAGPVSHVLGLYGVGADGERRGSYRLAAAVAPPVARAMGIREVAVVSRIGQMDYSQYIFYKQQFFVSALVECGSHEHEHDARLLRERPDLPARGIVEGIRAYFERRGSSAGVVWSSGRLSVKSRGTIARAVPARSGRVLRALDPGSYTTDGYTDGGQAVYGSSRWYHLSRESGYGWVHSSGGAYTKEGER